MSEEVMLVEGSGVFQKQYRDVLDDTAWLLCGQSRPRSGGLGARRSCTRERFRLRRERPQDAIKSLGRRLYGSSIQHRKRDRRCVNDGNRALQMTFPSSAVSGVTTYYVLIALRVLPSSLYVYGDLQLRRGGFETSDPPYENMGTQVHRPMI